jgi:cell division protein FtsI/penicillin-binding protein 2
MFERRLRFLFLMIFVLLAGLGLRAVQVQVGQHAKWQEVAERRSQVSTLLDTTRGRILDVRGRELALNAACIDACVHYQAILPQPDERLARERPPWVREQEKWVRQQALARLKGSLGATYQQAEPAQKRQLLQDQIAQVRLDIERMWAELGSPQLTGYTREQIEEQRQTVMRRVEMRRRYLWYANYAAAAREHQSREPSPWYLRLLTDEQAQAPELDEFDITVKEQYETHLILPAISADLANHLGKAIERFPGLVLQPGQQRVYPYASAASHVIGHLGKASAQEMERNPWSSDPLGGYWPNDLAGRGGMEGFAETVLRGKRGEIFRRREDDRILSQTAAVPGEDVHLSLDIQLQRRVEELFAHPMLADGSRDAAPMYGAAVVIDVPSGEVRALVSYPTYDLNEFDRLYARMVHDDINRPLMNRATQAQLEPGSTVKPMVGIAGMMEGVLGEHEPIICNGYLVLQGRRFADGKCHGGRAHGPLAFREALERSCNVFHENVAARLGIDRLSEWYGRFGLGHPVEIGLSEPVTQRSDGERRTGRLPSDFEGPSYLRSVTTWFGGIGQGSISATPLQMANAAATIARDGHWRRPRLALSLPLPESEVAEQRDLGIRPQAMAAAREGMISVVEGAGGTGRSLRIAGLRVAGKTGTAQAARFTVPQRDAAGNIVRANGQTQRVILEPSTPERPNPQAPWYRANAAGDLSHAWFIGFAPAVTPQLAFAVLV